MMRLCSPAVLASSPALTHILSVQPTSAPSPSFPFWTLPPLSLQQTPTHLSVLALKGLFGDL